MSIPLSENMSKVLVTGGLGFIGSYTVDRLVDLGHEVVILDNLERQVHFGKVPDYANKKAVYFNGDVRFKKHWIKALDGVEGVIHLAGAVGIGQSFWEARKYTDVNSGGTATLFEVLIKNNSISKNIKKIVVASSKSMYGEGAYRCQVHGIIFPKHRTVDQLKSSDWEIHCPECGRISTPIGISENKPPQNLNPYSLSKYSTEKLALDYSQVLGIPTVALRYFNVYGPRQSLSNPYTGVVAIFLSRLKNGKPPYLFEDGQQLRDYIYVEDVAKINVASLTKGDGAYNVGTGKPNSLLDVVSTLNTNLGKDIEPVVSGDYRPGDNRHDYADISRLLEEYGPLSFVKFESGLETLVEESLSVTALDMFEKEERERKKFLVTRG